VLPWSGSGLGLSIAINSRRDELLMRRWPGYLGLTDKLCHLLKIRTISGTLCWRLVGSRKKEEESVI